MATTPAVYNEGQLTKVSPISSAPVTLEVVSVKGVGQTWYTVNSGAMYVSNGVPYHAQWIATDDGVITGTTFVAPAAGVYQVNPTFITTTTGATVSGSLRTTAHLNGGGIVEGEGEVSVTDVAWHAVGLTLSVRLFANQTVNFQINQSNNSGGQMIFAGRLAVTRLS
jgi:hypothetical protein